MIAARAIGRFQWDKKTAVLFAVIAVIFSKAWLQINRVPDLSLYSLNFGPWLLKKYYILQGETALAAGVLFFGFLFFSGKFKDPAPAQK